MALCHIIVLALLGCLDVHAEEEKRFIDLTHLYFNGMTTWPADSHLPFNLTVAHRGKSDHGVYYQTNSFCTSEHSGTHLDAPLHFRYGARTISDMTLSELIGNGVMMDISQKGMADRDYIAKQSDIEEWEKEHGRIPDGSIFFLNTGRHRYWDDPKLYFGVDRRGKMHFPGIDVEAVKWLVEERKIKLFGSDLALDPGSDQTFRVHYRVQAHYSIGIIDFLANLDEMPPTGSTVFAIPMKIKDGSGAPVRVFAMVEGGATLIHLNMVLILAIFILRVLLV